MVKSQNKEMLIYVGYTTLRMQRPSTYRVMWCELTAILKIPSVTSLALTRYVDGASSGNLASSATEGRFPLICCQFPHSLALLHEARNLSIIFVVGIVKSLSSVATIICVTENDFLYSQRWLLERANQQDHMVKY